MNIQAMNSYPITATKRAPHLPSNFFLSEEQQGKTTYEIKKEDGYLRHYVTKANGERVMVKESKLPKSQKEDESTGDLQGMVDEIVIKKLTDVLDPELVKLFSKTGVVAQKEKQLERYMTSI